MSHYSKTETNDSRGRLATITIVRDETVAATLHIGEGALPHYLAERIADIILRLGNITPPRGLTLADLGTNLYARGYQAGYADGLATERRRGNERRRLEPIPLPREEYVQLTHHNTKSCAECQNLESASGVNICSKTKWCVTDLNDGCSLFTGRIKKEDA